VDNHKLYLKGYLLMPEHVRGVVLPSHLPAEKSNQTSDHPELESVEHALGIVGTQLLTFPVSLDLVQRHPYVLIDDPERAANGLDPLKPRHDVVAGVGLRAHMQTQDRLNRLPAQGGDTTVQIDIGSLLPKDSRRKWWDVLGRDSYKAGKAISELISAVPEGTEVGLHVGYNWRTREDVADPRRLEALVETLNWAREQWPNDRPPANYVSIPFGATIEQPRGDEYHDPIPNGDYYKALGGLLLPQETRLAVGIVPSTTSDAIRQASLGRRDAIEDITGRPVSIAPAFSLRPQSQAYTVQALRTASAVAEAQ